MNSRRKEEIMVYNQIPQALVLNLGCTLQFQHSKINSCSLNHYVSY